MKEPRCFHLIFDGKSKSREKFLQDARKEMMKLDFEGINAVIMIFHEMIKNIYDHADGLGEVHFEERLEQPNIFDFKVFDYGTGQYNFEGLIRTSRLSGHPDHPQNGAVGLYLIQGYATQMDGVSIRINTSHGFHYEGTFDLNKMI